MNLLPISVQSVCMNALILVTLSIRGTKSGIKIAIYRTKVKLASHFECHVHRPPKIEKQISASISISKRKVSFVILYAGFNMNTSTEL